MKRWARFSAALSMILIVLIGAAYWIGAQIDDPAGIGRMQLIYDQGQDWQIPDDKVRIQPMPFNLPPPPFTIEATARFSIVSPNAQWVIETPFLHIQVLSNGVIYTDQKLSIKRLVLHPPGDLSQVRLSVQPDLTAAVTINNQWVATLQVDSQVLNPMGSSWSVGIGCYCGGSAQHVKVTWEHVMLYTSRTP